MGFDVDNNLVALTLEQDADHADTAAISASLLHFCGTRRCGDSIIICLINQDFSEVTINNWQARNIHLPSISNIQKHTRSVI